MVLTTYAGRELPEEEETEEVEEAQPVGAPPVRVQIAFNFVALSGQQYGWHQFATNDETGAFSKFRKKKMSPFHRYTYNRACHCLARYFDGQDVDAPQGKYEPN